MYTVPFHGLVGVLVNPASSSFFSSPAYFTSNLKSLREAVTFMSSKPGEDPACSPGGERERNLHVNNSILYEQCGGTRDMQSCVSYLRV